MICFFLDQVHRGVLYMANKESVFARCLNYPRMVQLSPTEAAHTGPRGLSAKSDDRTAIPLCGHEHHREGKQSHHKLGKKFFEHHHIDRDALVAELNKQYDSIQQRRTA